MGPLPIVLLTDCIRSASAGGSHGGAYLVDLERATWRRVLDWNDSSISWEGRGSDRGLRGIAFHNGEVYIAASDELFVFDQDFRIKRSFRNRYLGHCHEIHRRDDTLFLTSTRFDSILAFDLQAQRFVRGYMFRLSYERDPRTHANPGPVRRRFAAFDPNSEVGPAAGDTAHLNHVWTEGERVFFSGVRLKQLFYFDPSGAVGRHAGIPEWTHNARPYKGGVLCNSTSADVIAHADLDGRTIKEFPVPRYPDGELLNKPGGTDVARQAFGRGLVTTDDGLIIGGSSPSTVTVYDWETTKVVKSVNITMDVRNAPHGLALWPYS